MAHAGRTKSAQALEPEAHIPAELDERQMFYDDLKQFGNATEAVIELSPSVEGRPVELFDLFQAVAEQRVDLDEVDWRLVAETLNFNWIGLPKVPETLAKCYEDNLAGFEEAMAGFAEEEEDLEDSAIDDEQRPQVAFESPTPQGSVHRDSLPATRPAASWSPSPARSLKRKSSDIDAASDTPPRAAAGKRPRYSRDDEIPSTPEESPHTQSGSRNLNARSERRLQTSPLSRGVQSMATEPETQDFGFEVTQRPSLATHESTMYDISPSQQLQSEADNAQPIPFILNPHRSRSRTPDALGSPQLDTPTAAGRNQRLDERDSEQGDQTYSAGPRSRRRLPRSFRRASAEATSSGSAPVDKSRSTKAKARQAEPPTAPTTTPAKGEPEKVSLQRIEECIKHFEVYYPHNVVIKGLISTTIDPGLAGVVMQSLVEGKGIPDHNEGIWTKRDDESLSFMDEINANDKPRTVRERHLLSGAKREWERLVRKHGMERIEDRRKFLTYSKTLGDHL
jgi:hypothetical protein